MCRLPTASTHEVSVGVEKFAPITWGEVGWDIATDVRSETRNVVVTAARLMACSRLQTEVAFGDR